MVETIWNKKGVFKINGRERVMKVLNHEIPDRVPVYEVLIDSPMVEYVLDIKGKNSAQLSAREIVKLHKDLGLDAVIANMKFWRPFEMKGKQLDIKTIAKPLKEDIDFYLNRCMEIVKYAHEEGLAVAAYNHGCFDVTYESLGFENFMYLLYDDFEYVEEVMESFHQYHKRITELALQTGVDYMLIGDDIAFKTGLFINPSMFMKLWYEREKEMVGLAKKAGKPVEFHTDGKIGDILLQLIEIGVDLVNPVEPYSNDIFELKKQYGDRIAFRGNIDIAGVLATGTPEETFSATKELVLKMKPGGNYVCSTSHSISNAVKPENYLELVRAVKEYGLY